MNKLLILFIFLSFLLVDKASAQSNQVVSNGTLINAINFSAGCSYTWVNNNPAIGLAASGTGNIPAFTIVNTGTAPIIATITATPQTGGFVYISNKDDNTMSVIRIADNAVVATIPLQSDPSGVSVTADGSKVFVSNSFSRSVSMIDAVTNTVIKHIPVVDYSISIRVNKDGSRLYVANYNNRTVSVINTATNVIIATIPAGFNPYNICISPDGSRLYVTNNDYTISTPTTVTVINTLTNTLVTQITVGVEPEGITINKDGSGVYVANMRSGTVSVINTATNTVTETIPVGGSPHDLAVSPDGRVLYTRDQTTNQLIATNLLTKVATRINVAGIASHGIDVSADGLFVYISNHYTNNVSVVNTVLHTEVAIISVGRSPSSTGEFVSAGISCSPTTFTITVNPDPITTISNVGGNITACAGSASTSTQQFTLSGTYLKGNVTATAPAGFEISTSANSNYSNILNLTATNGSINVTTIYVRAAGTANAGTNNANVVISTNGVTDKIVAVSATINAVPTVNPLSNIEAKVAATVNTIHFTGNAGHYSWTNNNPAIGLAASGTDDIPAFTAANNGTKAIDAVITVTPLGNSTCPGTPVTFTITVTDDGKLNIGNVSGAITACSGTASVNTQQFSLSGSFLKGDVTATAPAGFEISTSAGNSYSSTLNLQPVNGAINGTVVYVRSMSTANAGVINGSVLISSSGVADRLVAVSGIINAVPTVNAVSNIDVKTGAIVGAVFTGTADNYNWTNNNLAIGLAATGIGNIAAFIALNTSDKPIIATITVNPVNNTLCTGIPITFTITIAPAQKAQIIAPSAFTPNGDGINDNWIIQNISVYPNTIVKIFNRLGTVVFTSTGYPQPWDGKSGNTNVPSGTYYYLIDTNENKVISGYLTVIR